MTIRNTIAILTLRRHEDGIWITRLVEHLQQQILLQVVANNDKPKIQVQVVVLEDLLQGPLCVSSLEPQHGFPSSSSSSWLGVVNRISDAAEPFEVKACLAILNLAKLVWKIPIWNGPDAYSLCVNKWCHHVLFAQAKLASPPTTALMIHQGPQHEQPEIKSLQLLSQMQKQQDGNPTHNNNNEESPTIQLEYLVKPNAGGFGAGIEKRKAQFTTAATTSTSHIIQHPTTPIPAFSDHMVLFQKYVKSNKIYRVWFFAGRVQCAVQRTTVMDDDDNDNVAESTMALSSSEFTSGCAGSGACTITRPPAPSSNTNKSASSSNTTTATATGTIGSSKMEPWKVPACVRQEMEQQLLPVLPHDAHCGSVEFLYDTSQQQQKDNTRSSSGSDDDDEGYHSTRQRLYFDLNLLSTLPVVASSSFDDAVDPWRELANAICEFMLQ